MLQSAVPLPAKVSVFTDLFFINSTDRHSRDFVAFLQKSGLKVDFLIVKVLLLMGIYPRLRTRAVVVAEWLRRWTRNPLGSPRAGSNPADYVCFSFAVSLLECIPRTSSAGNLRHL